MRKQRIQQYPPEQKQQISAQAQFSDERSIRRSCQACRATGNCAFCHVFIVDHLTTSSFNAHRKLRHRETGWAAPKGQGLTASESELSHKCNFCQLVSPISSFFCCSKCRSVMYCGKDCQKSNFSRHRVLCDSFFFLSNKEKVERNCSQEDMVYVSNLSPKQRNQVAKLVGEKCLIKCKLSEKDCEVLWDSGAQVSIISLQTLWDRFLKVDIKEIKELLDGQEIDLRAANGTSVPYLGWTELIFSLDCDKDVAQGSITVPFLVTGSTLEHQIVGFNVISEIVNIWQRERQISDALEYCFVLTAPQKIDQLVNLIQRIDQESLTPVKTSKYQKFIKA